MLDRGVKGESKSRIHSHLSAVCHHEVFNLFPSESIQHPCNNEFETLMEETQRQDRTMERSEERGREREGKREGERERERECDASLSSCGVFLRDGIRAVRCNASNRICLHSLV